MSEDWPLWEVFVRTKGGLSHRHVGSVHAPDPQLALAHARDTYTRRMEGVSLWVVPSKEIVASDPEQAGELSSGGPNIISDGHHQRFSASCAIRFCSGVPLAIAIMIS